MKALIIYKNDTAAYAKACELDNMLLARGLTTTLIESRALTKTDILQADLAFVLGGDGTVINSAISLAGRDIPIAGINFGRVGFLSSMEPDELAGCLDRILAGHYLTQKRMIIRASVISEGETRYQWNALNDIVIKTCMGHPISMNIRLNDENYCTFRGDGLICATPSGSTAYSYSAGGPIIDLDLPALVITPICPHMSIFRAVVVSAESRLGLVMDSEYESRLYIDGKKGIYIRKGDCISIENSGLEAGFIKLGAVNNAARVIYKRHQLNRESELINRGSELEVL